MNLIALKDNVLFFVSQWAGTTLPRLVAIFAGLLLCGVMIQMVWHKRMSWTLCSIGVLIGVSLAVFGLDPGILHGVVRITDPMRLRIVVGISSAMVIGITFESIRRSLLQERYAILWLITGFLLLFSAILPDSIDLIATLFGADYWFVVVGTLGAFILLIAFHFSIAFSRNEARQTKLAQRCADLESRIEQLENTSQNHLPDPIELMRLTPSQDRKKAKKKIPHRPVPGATVLLPLLILLSSVITLIVGLRNHVPMVGDEVTHFYMMQYQETDLSTPNFTAHIPTSWGDEEVRRYPHVNAWHYLGAMVYRIMNRSFGSIQVYQLMYWLQFLLASLWLARRRNGKSSYAPILYLITLISIPATCMFSVVFYQDIPAAAQVITAFCFLISGHWIIATLFLILGISIKVTIFVFIPIFVVMALLPVFRERGFGRMASLIVLRIIVMGGLFFGMSYGWSHVLNKHIDGTFYPYVAIEKTWNELKEFGQLMSGSKPVDESNSAASDVVSAAEVHPRAPVTSYEKEIIANHPGDLRMPKNYLIYGGALIWIVMLLGIVSRVYVLAKGEKITGEKASPPSSLWLLFVGFAYILPTAYFLRTAPDARFFLPALPFILLPFCEWCVKLPRIKIILTILTALAVLQMGYVYNKIIRLRSVPEPLQEAIEYLAKHKPEPDCVFMYPEGNYRLFPVTHKWYLDYWLRDFWRGGNDFRIQLLQENGIGAIVVKKHLVSLVDEEITDLGVYPTYFVEEIDSDPRFVKQFENEAVTIYSVPARSE